MNVADDAADVIAVNVACSEVDVDGGNVAGNDARLP